MVTDSVFCRKTAAVRSIAQSPPDGTPCGSMYVMAEAVKDTPLIVRSLTGLWLLLFVYGCCCCRISLY